MFSFSDDFDECFITENRRERTPVAWSNIMTGKRFGCIVTEGMGGFTWFDNSKTNRITLFSNDCYEDSSSEYFLLDEGDVKYSLDVNNLPDENDYNVTFGFGYSVFEHESEKLRSKLTMFVPLERVNGDFSDCKEDLAKVSSFVLENKTDSKLNVKVKYVVSFLMGESEDCSFIKESFKENLRMFVERNLGNRRSYIAYIASDECMNANKEIEFFIKPKEKKVFNIVLGVACDEDEAFKMATDILHNYEDKFAKTKEYWSDLVKRCTCKTCDSSFDCMQNGWLAYQAIASRLYARTGFYQTSGAYGFRDQMQDAIGMKWVDENILRRQIWLNANHQFLEGDVMHWWHEDEKLGIRTRYSDDLLFLPYGVIEYINFTGDYSILHEKAKYIEESELKENEKDRVIRYKVANEDGTILEHVLKAIERSLRFGKDNLPLMQSGDWNDGMNKIGEDGKGESVWLGFFLYDILNKFSEILTELLNKEDNILNTEALNQKRNIPNKVTLSEESDNVNAVDLNEKSDTFNKETSNEEYEMCNTDILEIIEKYKTIMQGLKYALNTVGWDGRWFKRAIDDQGKDVGSNLSEECKIDNEVQAWAVMSGAADNDKKYIAMQSLQEQLVDEKHNLVKLLTPPLEKLNLGYISSYQKGVRENGGQYTHALIWDVIANCMLNQNDRAYELLKKANPVEHTKSKEAQETYKVEPYVVAADIYSSENLAGHGGWTWYTGSAAWMYEAQIKYILGLNIYHKKMTIKPHIPSTWNEYKLTFKYKNAIYNFNIKRSQEENNENETTAKDTKETKKNSKEIELKERGVYNIEIKI